VTKIFVQKEGGVKVKGEISQKAVVISVIVIVVAIVAGAIGYVLKPAEVAPGATTTVTAPGATTTVTAPGATTTVTAPGATTTVTKTETTTALGPPKPGEGLTFTFINIGDPANPFHAKIAKGWFEAASVLGVNAVITYGYGDESKSIDDAYEAVAMGVDGIFIFNTDPEGFHPVIEAALNKGIEVVTMSGRDPVYGPENVPFVGFDLSDQGYVVGKYLAEQLKTRPGAPFNIIFFAEFLAPYSALRRQGTEQALKDAGITYTAPDTFEVGEEVSDVIMKIKTYLQAHPETDVIAPMGSVTTPASFIALQELGYKPGEILWAGYDLLPETVEGIKLGYGAANADEVFDYGWLSCLTLYLKAKYDMTVGDMPVGMVMVDQTNIAEFEYWAEQGIK
jgi:ABC-type sugar transport system substrate-binding protein